MGGPRSNVQGIAATRFPSHQLSNGLYVSGHQDQHQEKGPTMSVSQMPYTGGDVKKSGELGKMFDISVESSNSGKLRNSGPMASIPKAHSGPQAHSGPLLSHGPSNPAGSSKPVLRPGQASKSGPIATRKISNSGPLTGNAGGDHLGSGSMKTSQGGTRRISNSGPLTGNAGGDHLGSGNMKSSQGGTFSKLSGSFSSRSTSLNPKNSNPKGIALPATGLITSGPITSGPITSGPITSGPISGPISMADAEGTPGKPLVGGVSAAINNLSHDQEFSFRKNFPKVVLWTVIPLFVMGFIAGAFIIVAVQNSILLIVVAALFLAAVMLFLWNSWWGKRSVTGFLTKYPHSELGSAKDGQYVKITGVVTCGSVPLESSYEKVNRCMYTSTGLYEYRGLFSKPANERHRWFTWGIRHMERHVVDFYISDFQTGLRALVKAGYGARITPYVQESAVLDITPRTSELPSDFVRWLTDRKLSRDERIMKLKEGYIKEGSIVTVLGAVQRHENVLMIVPPSEVVSTGCQWTKFLLPANLEGIILTSDDSSQNEGIPL